MPRQTEIKKTLVIGSGPIIIGQAAEFDYSGTQACQALREEGVEVVLINSNPATIMTDNEVADKIYIEPITSEMLEVIIRDEKPDSLLAGMGGQTALNMALTLHEKGILEKYGVKLIGTSINGIMQGEDRALFKDMMARINEPVIQSEIVTEVEAAVVFANQVGYPVIIRPAYTLGGTGGGIADDEEMLRTIAKSGLDNSPVNQVLIEKSIKGWKEIEYEVMRDAKGNRISVCNMENIDPVGIHTGDSIVVAPSQTLSDKEYQMLRTSAFKIIEAIGIEGGCNVQFALHPESFEYAVIEINPRVSRSSALASKATGYPIAKVAAKIALGYGLDEIKNAVTGVTYACFEPSLDYVVVKFPKWPFEKFYKADRTLGTKMMATGEIMAIGSNFEAAFLKGLRSLELGQYHLKHKGFIDKSTDALKNLIKKPNDERIFALTELIRRDYKLDMIHKITGIDEWFLDKIKNLIQLESEIETQRLVDIKPEKMRLLKRKGFSDKGLAELLSVSPKDIYNYRKAHKIIPVFHMVDTCAGEFEAVSPYYYSSYETYDEVKVTEKEKIVVIGSGPIRIGQGIEFDYASVHCIKALKAIGYETIIINSNPETVSTDFSIADKLYFEPLTEEEVLNILQKENPKGVIVQFGGQTAIKLADFIEKSGYPIFGASYDQIDICEDRDRFEVFLEAQGIARPKGIGVENLEAGLSAVEKLGLPVLVRPSYVLGGQGMKICRDVSEVKHYLTDAFTKNKKNPVLIDKYLVGMEVEVDAISDGNSVLIPGIMEHIERAGIHSGDSMTVYPPQNISQALKNEILNVTKKIASGLNLKGMINIQFVISEDKLYVIEVSPRASRTVPYLSKVSGVPIVDLATKVSLGESLCDLEYGVDLYPEADLISVKVPVFSTQKLPDVEISLGPEMKSTGEVLGIGKTYAEALTKGFLAAKTEIDLKGAKILLTLNENDKAELCESDLPKKAQFVATTGTAKRIEALGRNVLITRKIRNESSNLLSLIKDREIGFIINTPTVGEDSERDGFMMRRLAAEHNIPMFTSLDTYRAWLKAFEYSEALTAYQLKK